MNTIPSEKEGIKCLLFDIETAANLAYVWGKFEQDVIRFQSEWYMLSWSAKWLNGEHITKCLADYQYDPNDPHNDKELVTDLWKLFNEADVIIGHNGDKFDIKKANTRFIEHGLPPPAPYKTVDTLKVARKYFGFNSNKLDDLGRRLGVGRKIKHSGFDLWLGCIRGELASWKKMKSYNRQDVVLLERVYLKLRPWIENHPPTSEDPAECPCGGLYKKRGSSLLKGGKRRQRFQCKKCGKWEKGKIIS